jgi:hypothetical protein
VRGVAARRKLLIVGIARMLGVDGLGNYQIVMAQYAVFEALITLGLWSFTIREIGADRSRAGTIFFHGSLVSLVMSIVASGGLYIASLDTSPEVRLGMLIMCAALWPAGISTFADSVFLAFERATYVAVSMLGEEVLLTLVAFGLLWVGYPLPMAIAAVAGARIIGAVVRTVLARRIAGAISWRIDWKVLWHLLRHAPVFLSTSMLWTLFWRMDVIMLSRLSTPEQVPLYRRAARRHHAAGSAQGDHGHALPALRGALLDLAGGVSAPLRADRQVPAGVCGRVVRRRDHDRRTGADRALLRALRRCDADSESGGLVADPVQHHQPVREHVDLLAQPDRGHGDQRAVVGDHHCLQCVAHSAVRRARRRRREPRRGDGGTGAALRVLVEHWDARVMRPQVAAERAA